MRRYVVSVVLALALALSAGCTPFELAGGLVAMRLVQEGVEKEQRAERARIAAQERVRNEQEKARLAAEKRHREELERQRAAELAQRRQAEQERQRREEQERRRQLEEEKRQRQAEEHMAIANRILNLTIQALQAGKWNALPQIQKAVAATDKLTISAELRQKIHLAGGLYAWVADDANLAAEHFATAKHHGCGDPNILGGEVFWTAGAREAFSRAAPQ